MENRKKLTLGDLKGVITNPIKSNGLIVKSKKHGEYVIPRAQNGRLLARS